MKLGDLLARAGYVGSAMRMALDGKALELEVEVEHFSPGYLVVGIEGDPATLSNMVAALEPKGT